MSKARYEKAVRENVKLQTFINLVEMRNKEKEDASMIYLPDDHFDVPMSYLPDDYFEVSMTYLPDDYFEENKGEVKRSRQVLAVRWTKEESEKMQSVPESHAVRLWEESEKKQSVPESRAVRLWVSEFAGDEWFQFEN